MNDNNTNSDANNLSENEGCENNKGNSFNNNKGSKLFTSRSAENISYKLLKEGIASVKLNKSKTQNGTPEAEGTKSRTRSKSPTTNLFFTPSTGSGNKSEDDDDEWKELDSHDFLSLFHVISFSCLTACDECMAAKAAVDGDSILASGSGSGFFRDPYGVQSYSKIEELLERVLSFLNLLKNNCSVLCKLAIKSDPMPDCPYNGFRSLLSVVKVALKNFDKPLQQFLKNHKKTLTSLTQIHSQLVAKFDVLELLSDMIEIILGQPWSDENYLFIGDAKEYLECAKKMNTQSVLGEEIGFQFSTDLQNTFRVILLAMMSFRKGYCPDGGALDKTKTMIASLSYMANTDSLAENLSSLRNIIDVKFLQEFWNLTESTPVRHGPKILGPSMNVNKVFTIPVVDLSEHELSILFTDIEQVKFRLLSVSWLQGQIYKEAHIYAYDTFIKENKKKFSNRKSTNLVIHFHGGGFISQTSLSHEVYLRPWARDLKCPIISVDYSISPQVQYPVALHECFFTYLWCLENLEKLGTSGEKIVFVGDSAGGNLVMAVALMAASHNVRVPDLCVPVYPSLHIKNQMSPSRCLAIIDPLLSPNILVACMNSYAPDCQDDFCLSPTLVDGETLLKIPRIFIAACEYDALLDDSILFARKLYQFHPNFKFKVLEAACHGFLNFMSQSKHAQECTDFVLEWILDFLGIQHSKSAQPAKPDDIELSPKQGGLIRGLFTTN